MAPPSATHGPPGSSAKRSPGGPSRSSATCRRQRRAPPWRRSPWPIGAASAAATPQMSASRVPS